MAWHRGYANGPGGGDSGRMHRWSRLSADERSQYGRRIRCSKRVLHSHLNGHFRFMTLCWQYQRLWGCVLTPADRAYIRVKHAAEIAFEAVDIAERESRSVSVQVKLHPSPRCEGYVPSLPDPSNDCDSGSGTMECLCGQMSSCNIWDTGQATDD